MSDKLSVLRGPKEVKAKVRTVTRSMTTPTAICSVPRGARLLGAIVFGTASDAGTTATLSLGSSSGAGDEFGTANVLAAGIGNGGFFGFDSNNLFTADGKVYAIYAETGTGSNAGAWTVAVLYTEGNDIADDTI